MTYTIVLDKWYSTWHYTVENPVGGSFGSNVNGTKKAALRQALRGVPPGEPYEIITKHEGRALGEEA